MIPTEVNWKGVLDELNQIGIPDGKVELICNFTPGYIAQIRCGNIACLGWKNGAKLLNLLDEEMRK
jgi:hypothetical protein